MARETLLNNTSTLVVKVHLTCSTCESPASDDVLCNIHVSSVASLLIYARMCSRVFPPHPLDVDEKLVAGCGVSTCETMILFVSAISNTTQLHADCSCSRMQGFRHVLAVNHMFNVHVSSVGGCQIPPLCFPGPNLTCLQGRLCLQRKKTCLQI